MWAFVIIMQETIYKNFRAPKVPKKSDLKWLYIEKYSSDENSLGEYILKSSFLSNETLFIFSSSVSVDLYPMEMRF